ncbi:MAG TPA: hypothetical protein VFF06_13660 [Polyangia bacterium]|nr:hypothetical protein [Polyangia bacterium]
MTGERIKLTNYNVAAGNVGFAILVGALLGAFLAAGLADSLPVVAALIVGGGVPIAACVALASRTVTSIVITDRVLVHRVFGRVELPLADLYEIELGVRSERAALRGHSVEIGKYLVATLKFRANYVERTFTIKIDRDEVATLRALVGAERVTTAPELAGLR